jgi:hypothetical protein
MNVRSNGMPEVSRWTLRTPGGLFRVGGAPTVVSEVLFADGFAWGPASLAAIALIFWQPGYLLGAFIGVLILLVPHLGHRALLRVPATCLLPTPIVFALMGAEISAAASMRWEGTISVGFPSSSEAAVKASGKAAVIDNGNGFTLQTLRPVGGSFGTGTALLTDPEAPTIAAIRLEAGAGFGTLAPFDPLAPLGQPQLTQNQLPLYGTLKLCLLSSACSAYVPIPLASPSFEAAVGIGGLVTVGPGSIRISVEAAPWTLRDATVTMATPSGNTFQSVTSGSVHGPYSFTGSTALIGGQLSLVTPMLITSDEFDVVPMAFARLTLRFVPEPGPLVLVASGIAGILIVARTRRRGPS